MWCLHLLNQILTTEGLGNYGLAVKQLVMTPLIGLKVAETKEKNSLGFVGQNLKRKHAVKSWGKSASGKDSLSPLRYGRYRQNGNC
ncbi:hypothetical protein NC651_006208 [Populus alba x Populus x berolinensis]|nr:hypothetical protein NC651_006208 [Populus alba x Populus x berolinensis]